MTNPMDRREVLGVASLAAAASLLGSGEAEAEAEAEGGNLTVHVLDLYSGTPASGVKVDLFMREGEQMTAVKSVVTDADGRSGQLLAGEAFAAGRYLLALDLYGLFQGRRQDPAGEFLPQTVARVRGHRPDRAAPHTVAMHAVDAGMLGAAGLMGHCHRMHETRIRDSRVPSGRGAMPTISRKRH